MKPQQTKYKIQVWYRLSCNHAVTFVYVRRGNTGICSACGEYVFILETCYVKPDAE